MVTVMVVDTATAVDTTTSRAVTIMDTLITVVSAEFMILPVACNERELRKFIKNQKEKRALKWICA